MLAPAATQARRDQAEDRATVEPIPVPQSLHRSDSGSGITLRLRCGATREHKLAKGSKDENKRRREYPGIRIEM
jgi:hypothetical protein